MTNREIFKLLGEIERELIKQLNYHKNEKLENDAFKKNGHHESWIEYAGAYEDGAIFALIEAIKVIRKRYPNLYY